MTELIKANTAEGLSNTTAVTIGNSGGGSGDAFDAVVGAITASTTQRRQGNVSYQVPALTGTSGNAMFYQATGGTRYAAASGYFYLTASPTVACQFLKFQSDNGSTNVVRAVLKTTRAIRLQDKAGIDLGVDSAALPANTWCRWSMWADVGATNGTGSVHFRVYDADDSTVLVTQDFTGLTLGTLPIVACVFGKSSNSGNIAIHYMDALRFHTDRQTEAPFLTPATAILDDPVGVTGAASLAWDLVRTGADPVGVVDSVTATQDLARIAADPVGVSDAAGLAWGLTRGVADPVGVTDGVTATWGLVRAAADPVGVVDAVTAGQGPTVTDDDPVGVSDGLTVGRGTGISFSDPVGVLDGLVLERGLSRVVGDLVNVADAVTVDRGYEVHVGDAVTVTDTVTLTRGQDLLFDDGVAVVDGFAAIVNELVQAYRLVLTLDRAAHRFTMDPAAKSTELGQNNYRLDVQ